MQYAHKLALLTAAAIVGLSGQANAQQMKPAKPDHDMKEMQKASRDAQKDAMKAAKEQQKDAMKIVKDEQKATREANEDAAKATRNERTDVAKADERAQHESFKTARQQSSRLTNGVKLTSAQRRQFESMRKRYDAQYRALEKQERRLDKANQSDAAVLQQLEALRLKERTDLRAILTPEQQAIFDRNAAAPANRS